MQQTMSEKILSKASGRTDVRAGDVVWAKVDVLMSHDPCAPGVISIFKREFGSNATVWDPSRFIMIPDHFVFSADALANANVRIMREFATEQNIVHFYDVGTPRYKGVCHIALAEGGHNRPGEVLLGTDSHTVTSGAFGTFAIGVGNTDAGFTLGVGESLLKVPATIRIDFNGTLPPHVMAKDLILSVMGELGVDGGTYKTLEFGGEVIDALSVQERMTICNMVVECGAKNGIMVPNAASLEYIRERTTLPFESITPDSGAHYLARYSFDVTNFSAKVARPHTPDNVVDVETLQGTPLERAYIGSCTGGKLEDFIAAARILKGNKTRITTFAVPATKETLDGMIRTKIDGTSVYEIFVDAGVNVSTEPGCAACCGGPMDTFGRVNQPLAVISTTNRNFVGRMGHKGAQIFLASPYTVAASAIAGTIANPAQYF